MKNASRLPYATRETILKLLSADEVARVGTAQNAVALVDGDEFINLEELELGVLRAIGTSSVPLAHVLARKAVET